MARDAPRPLRLFVGIEIPEPIRDVLEAGVAPVRDTHPRARWVPKHNQHVTLKFLGTTWPRLLGWVRQAVEDVARAGAPFETRVDGLGAFPNERRARVLWAGLRDPLGRMTDLAGALDEALAREFAPEKRGFTPHLTVARFDPPVALGALPPLASDAFPVGRLVLFRSHLRRPAPVYEPLAVPALGG